VSLTAYDISVKDVTSKIISNIEKVIIGKRDVISLILCSLFCEGHVLLEDVPGVGKTALAKAIAASLGCSYSRVQCTSDLLPSDILGINVYNQKSGEFVFRKGPISNNMVLVDEINRANPKTQSALLECMEEYQITADGTALTLPRPFMIIATQNPIEYDGTYPLPEAQLDRFFLKTSIGYPDEKSEGEMLRRKNAFDIIDSLENVSSLEEVKAVSLKVKEVHLEDSVRDYILAIVRSTRNEPSLVLGASPRASIAIFKASQAKAATEGRNYVTPDDVKSMVNPVLSHRLKTSFSAMKDSSASSVIEKIVSKIKVPV